jgi:hypothetical protein
MILHYDHFHEMHTVHTRLQHYFLTVEDSSTFWALLKIIINYNYEQNKTFRINFDFFFFFSSMKKACLESTSLNQQKKRKKKLQLIMNLNNELYPGTLLKKTQT